MLDLNSHEQRLAEMGRQYPREFVGILADQALETAHAWLVANGVPDSIVQLISQAYILATMEIEIEHAAMTDWRARELSELVPETLASIAAAGGAFHNGGMRSIPRQAPKIMVKPEITSN
jgi:hypothetical protein